MVTILVRFATVSRLAYTYEQVIVIRIYCSISQLNLMCHIEPRIYTSLRHYQANVNAQ